MVQCLLPAEVEQAPDQWQGLVRLPTEGDAHQNPADKILIGHNRVTAPARNLSGITDQFARACAVRDKFIVTWCVCPACFFVFLSFARISRPHTVVSVGILLAAAVYSMAWLPAECYSAD